MSSNSCQRLWEAEAIEDGRLHGDSCAGHQRHLEVCVECRDEVRALRRIRALARAGGAQRPPELERRRLRAQLLRAANHASVFGSSTFRRTWALVPVALLTLTLAFFALRARRAPTPAPTSSAIAVPTPTYDVVDVGAARWSVRQAAATTVIAQTEGRASFHVEHLLPGQRFLVGLPDGELEVRGTRFVITIVDARTSEVSVSEGVVALRLVGSAERLLAAGDRWSLEPAPIVSTAMSVAPKPVLVGTAAPTTLAPKKSVTSSAGSTLGPAKPKVGIATAMTAFQAGNLAEADSLFARFLEASPDDARCEDALFLRAVIRARLGDRAGAAKLLGSYLARYPNGLRKEDASRFAKTLAK